MVDLVERIEALLHQEEKLYNVKADYMSPWFQRKLQLANQNHTAATDLDTSSLPLPPPPTAEINEKWREVMCEWSFRVVDHFQLSRETVTIAMYYLDRYLGSHLVDKKTFQLAAMTSLYLANKLYGHRILPMKHLLELSGGSFTKKQMTVMEHDLLVTCQWHVHPPTAICFVQHLLFLFPTTTSTTATTTSCLSPQTRHELVEHARFLTELATLDYYMCLLFGQSEVALAALLNAMEDDATFCAANNSIPPHVVVVVDDVWRQLATFAPDRFHPQHPHVESARQRLRALLSHQRNNNNNNASLDWDNNGENDKATTLLSTRPSPTSPVCVAYLCENGHAPTAA